MAISELAKTSNESTRGRDCDVRRLTRAVIAKLDEEGKPVLERERGPL